MTQQDLFGAAPQQAKTAQSPNKPTARPTYNWFFALQPSVNDSHRIYATTAELLAAHSVAGKRTPPERLHITLEMIGHDLDAEVLDLACHAADTVSFPAIDVSFNAAMTFSVPGGPFVLLGTDGLDDVRKLWFELSCALADHGFSPPRSYEPHMTLCYDPRHRLPRIAVEPIGFHAGEFVLMKSHVGLSKYEVVLTWRLAGSPTQS
ncbi:MAG: 2'-5' RNA ligase family protein [Gammaproteobacteria bacterium]|nr:2'-5' RNA ligase family protein [Gammaproteobacteria bacterium]MDP2347351.1 2'-5' RNA ligase family protein [Gammaproteobacteria bacterium]